MELVKPLTRWILHHLAWPFSSSHALACTCDNSIIIIVSGKHRASTSQGLCPDHWPWDGRAHTWKVTKTDGSLELLRCWQRFDFLVLSIYVETWILCRVTNNIRVKKTRPEKSGGMGSSGEPSSNPYEVKPTPANPYEVKANPPNPYEVSLNSWKKWDPHINVALRWSQTLCIRDLQTDNRGSAILVALGQLLHR